MKYAFLLSLALALPLAAQQPPPGGPGGPGGMMQPYDATKEETFKAVVSEVATRERGNMVMVVLTVKVGDKEYAVMAGTENFLKEKKVTFAKNDQLTIKGVSGDSPRGPRIRAREITKGKDTLALLNKEGRPVWM